ncbi:MAG TPA: ABC transporter permease, partial [Chloroflexota bacterium]|nr:ABC transporter permease [Chloroflexota bacterium]
MTRQVEVLERLEGVDEPLPRRRRSFLRRVIRDPNACVGGVLVLTAAVLAVLAPALAPQDPLDISVDRLASPSWEHLLGTDWLGRDVLSRI